MPAIILMCAAVNHRLALLAFGWVTTQVHFDESLPHIKNNTFHVGKDQKYHSYDKIIIIGNNNMNR